MYSDKSKKGNKKTQTNNEMTSLPRLNDFTDIH